MSERMTTEQIEAIRKRAEAATAGPWIIEESLYEGKWNVGNEATELSACLCPENDAEFILKSREDIPALLAEVERLRKERYEQDAQFDTACLQIRRYSDALVRSGAENGRLRTAISESLSAHKWNNGESAGILEKALGGDTE